jgi:hypothetical protein
MKKLFAVMIVSAALAGAEARAQEHQHSEQKEESKMPVQKKTDAVKAEGMKCCEGMEKMGEIKAGMPIKSEMKSEMKGDMKAKMETMKAMQEKIAEKITDKGVKTQTQESKDEKSQPTKDGHQH